MTTNDTLKGATIMRPLFAMLATSLAFATPALAKEKNAHSAAVQVGTPKLGAVTFTAEGEGGSEMTSVLTVGTGEIASRKLLINRPNTEAIRKLLINRPNTEAIGYYDVTGYAMRFRVNGEIDGTAALQVFANVCQKTRVAGQEIEKDALMEISSLDDTIIPAANCRSVEQTLSIPDGDTVPLIVKATGERLGTLTWKTVPSTFTAGSSHHDH